MNNIKCNKCVKRLKYDHDNIVICTNCNLKYCSICAYPIILNNTINDYVKEIDKCFYNYFQKEIKNRKINKCFYNCFQKEIKYEN